MIKKNFSRNPPRKPTRGTPARRGSPNSRETLTWILNIMTPRRLSLTFSRSVVRGEYDDDRQQDHTRMTRGRDSRSRRHGVGAFCCCCCCCCGRRHSASGTGDEKKQKRPSVETSPESERRHGRTRLFYTPFFVPCSRAHPLLVTRVRACRGRRSFAAAAAADLFNGRTSDRSLLFSTRNLIKNQRFSQRVHCNQLIALLFCLMYYILISNAATKPITLRAKQT